MWVYILSIGSIHVYLLNTKKIIRLRHAFRDNKHIYYKIIEYNTL